MATSEIPKMPWGRVAALTAATFTVRTGLAAVAIHNEKREKAESERFRWTDKNRWE